MFGQLLRKCRPCSKSGQRDSGFSHMPTPWCIPTALHHVLGHYLLLSEQGSVTVGCEGRKTGRVLTLGG